MTETEVSEEEIPLEAPIKEKEEEKDTIFGEKESMCFLFVNNQSRVFRGANQ